jgi:hypothetical protein
LVVVLAAELLMHILQMGLIRPDGVEAWVSVAVLLSEEDIDIC